MPHEKLLMLNFSPLVCPIFQESSRTGQFHNSTWIAIARTNQATSPVKLLEQYIAGAHIDLSADWPLPKALANPSSMVMRLATQ